VSRESFLSADQHGQEIEAKAAPPSRLAPRLPTRGRVCTRVLAIVALRTFAR
jgi:hypothetical protein